MNQNTMKAPHEDAAVFIKDGITYVPHYRNINIFVGPGYGKDNSTRYSEIQLLSMGAEKAYMFLWPRSMHGIVSEVKP
jgi:hypothetical protein